ncbi:LptF/LptG family permease [Pelagibacteraceae bacterium]|nr:LptF/LptG family permease [Pelagibacteraceae bacterium]
MLQNKIYQNFIKEVLKTFFVILFGLTIIAWTVKAVNFLDLIVESGYSITTYFHYSILNIFGIITKFMPISFSLALIIFILKQTQENEFIILWTSGVKKLKVVNLFFIISIFILIIYLIFSIFLTPLALNKSRTLLSSENFNSFLPTVRIKEFSDSFEGFTFFVENKIENKVFNVFIHDRANVLKNLNAEPDKSKSTSIIAREGIVEPKKIILFDGQIISESSDKDNLISFDQINIDVSTLQTGNIKTPKLQETSSVILLSCLLKSKKIQEFNCTNDSKKEITSVLNRRIILPFYITVISLVSSFLLIKNQNNFLFNKYSIFIFSFLILLYSELIIRYTGISKTINLAFVLTPFVLAPIIYFFLIYKLSRESYN